MDLDVGRHAMDPKRKRPSTCPSRVSCVLVCQYWVSACLLDAHDLRSNLAQRSKAGYAPQQIQLRLLICRVPCSI